MKALNIVYHSAIVSREMRNKLNGHKSIVIWFTDLADFGKLTLTRGRSAKPLF